MHHHPARRGHGTRTSCNAVRGYVHYVHGHGPPVHGMRGGHYVAYTCRGGVWFRADDARVTKLDTAPRAFPYLVFLERLGCCPAQEPLRTLAIAGVPATSSSKRSALELAGSLAVGGVAFHLAASSRW